MSKEPKKKSEIKKAHCPKCGPKINCNLHGEFSYTDHDEDDGVWMSYLHQLYQCRGCELVFHTRTEVFSENVHATGYDWRGEIIYEDGATTYSWPAISKRQKPSWADKIKDEILSNLVSELYMALENDLRVLAAIGIRTIFDRSTKILGIKSTLTFANKLNELVTKKFILQSVRDDLEVLVDAGSAAAHRGWSPKASDLLTLVDSLEMFLFNVMLPKPDMKRLKVPPKPKATKKKSGKPKIAKPKAVKVKPKK